MGESACRCQTLPTAREKYPRRGTLLQWKLLRLVDQFLEGRRLCLVVAFMEVEMKYGYSEWIWSEKEILDRKGVISWHAKKYSPNQQLLSST
jgi:hypothetical protein